VTPKEDSLGGSESTSYDDETRRPMKVLRDTTGLDHKTAVMEERATSPTATFEMLWL
jgi:hypothetical protein